MPKLKVLFICTMNINRSRAAEDLLKNSDRYEVQSAGIKWHKAGGQVVTSELIKWADRIFVMDEKHDRHLSFLRENFGKAVLDKDLYVLNIPNVFGREDPALKDMLKARLKWMGLVI